MATLTLHPPDAASVVVELQHDVVTLGRNPDNRIVISSCYISGYHARFNRVKGADTYEVTDLESHNGTRINGIRIEKQLLHHGDMIQLGPALLARFEQERPVGAEEPGSLPAHASPEVKASVTYHGSGHGRPIGAPVTEASLLAEQRDEWEQLKVEVKKRRTELRVGESQLKEVRTKRDALLEAIAEAHREQAKVRDAAFAQDGVLRSGRETQAELESAIRQLKETQDREREALQKLRAEWDEDTAKHREIQTNLESARREEVRSLDDAAKARLEEKKIRGKWEQGRADLAALQETISARRETQKTTESAMAAIQDKTGVRQAQTGQGKTAAELESIRQALLIAGKERAQQQAVVKEAEQNLDTRRQVALTQQQELAAAGQDLAGTQQQVKDAGARLSQLNRAIAEAEAAATLRQQELDRKLDEGESRWQALESQAAEHRHQIAQPPPFPAGPGPATSSDPARPEETPRNPTESAGSIEDELIRLGFRVQPVKKNPGNAK